MAHPDTFQYVQVRAPVDRCVILDFSHGASETAPLLVVSLSVLPYRPSKGVGGQ